MSTMQIEMNFREHGSGSKSFKKRTVTLPEAIQEFDSAVRESSKYKNFNPVYRLARKLTGKRTFTTWQKTIAQNG